MWFATTEGIYLWWCSSGFGFGFGFGYGVKESSFISLTSCRANIMLTLFEN